MAGVGARPCAVLLAGSWNPDYVAPGAGTKKKEDVRPAHREQVARNLFRLLAELQLGQKDNPLTTSHKVWMDYATSDPCCAGDPQRLHFRSSCDGPWGPRATRDKPW